MANREENLKKLNDELEAMSDEELDKVAGGTKQELQELYDAMAGNPILCGYLKNSTRENIDPEEIARALDETMNVGFLYGPLDRKNEYISVINVNISHEEIVEACATYDRPEFKVARRPIRRK